MTRRSGPGPAGRDRAFVPPAYPYDRLDRFGASPAAHEGGMVDLSVGTPCDPPPPTALAALSGSGSERGYPASIGSADLRGAAARWIRRRFGIEADPDGIATCVGTKEFVATTPQWLHLREPSRDTVLYPAVSYPTYAMGATLAGCRSVPVALDERGCLDLGAVSDEDAERSLCLWVNSPGNPAGGLDDLVSVAAWGRARGIPVFSDECYAEFTWDGPPRTILEAGLDGVVAVHSISKRSNLAGARVGVYAGDADLVHYLAEVRKHVGLMAPGPVQAAAACAWSDDRHVDVQRARYLERLDLFASVLREAYSVDAVRPRGGFYLWVRAPGGDAWGFTERLAEQGGALVSPGEFYGAAGAHHVRIAMVTTRDRLELVADRLGAAGDPSRGPQGSPPGGSAAHAG
ncbi:MAG: aminotransferase class I/II-fold pyridoxal phosphate-dependent enzyme [Acidimicrobiales bacterium]